VFDDDSETFARSVRGALTSLCGDVAPVGASPDFLPGILAVAGEGGWFDLAEADALGAALAAMRELGRVASPFPLMDAYIAATLSDRLGKRVAAGEVVVGVVPRGEPGTASYVEAAAVLTHVLVLPAATAGVAAGDVTLHRVEGVEATAGLPRPDWSLVRYVEQPEEVLRVEADFVDRARVLLRLGLAARAAGAAERAHEYAVEHSRTRVQFGKVIGSFGAVQQRTATCAIDVAAMNDLLARAVAAHDAAAPDRPMSAELATGFVRDAARQVQLGAHHTLAAIGYFEEHVAPWLFRRVHADVSRLSLYAPAAGSPVDVLVETGATLPELALDEVAEAFRDEVRSVIDGLRGPGGRDDFDADSAVEAFASRGWYGMGWPEEHGGRNASLSEQVALHDEMAYSRVPAKYQLSSVMLIGAAIMRHGTEEQKAHYLPLIRAGKLKHCLGYSEPEVGSDLASLQTRAVRDGDDWVVNGQKVWTTRAPTADHVWLATRTDPDVQPRHAGITMFLVPMDTPGITVHPMTSLASEVSATVFYDDVRIPDTCRVGDVNGGWGVIMAALAGERVVMGGIASQLHRQLDDLVASVRSGPGGPDAVLGPRGSAARARLTEMVCRLQALRGLVAVAIGADSTDPAARLAAPMAGVMGGELAEDWGETLLDVLGPVAALGAGVPGVPGGGDFEAGLRTSVMYVVGGGTNDIQRGMIARGLGLPR
jgi:alkylation response protein AidB-like acyl-CoA dehydrogenase